MIHIKTPKEIEGIKKSCKLLAELFLKLEEEGIIKEGVSTKEVDRFVESFIKERGARPAFLGYMGYPAATCVSLNDEVVHGIPTEKRKIKKGDVIKIDSGINLDGFISDAARTYYVGDNPPNLIKNLMASVRAAFYNGISEAKDGKKLSDISHAIEETAKKYGVSVIKELGGHGVGLRLHEDPFVPNYGPPGRGPVLKAGMVLAIEPMFSAGSGAIYTKKDGWTIATRDGAFAAHYENTILITKDGVEILTEL